MDMTDLDTLAGIAQAATPGPWYMDRKRDEIRAANAPLIEGLVVGANGETWASLVIDEPDAAHITANSPDVTLSLIARIRQLEAALVEACELYKAAECVGPTRYEPVRIAELRALVQS